MDKFADEKRIAQQNAKTHRENYEASLKKGDQVAADKYLEWARFWQHRFEMLNGVTGDN